MTSSSLDSACSNSNVKLSLEDSRRLTGPNLFGAITGAIIDVEIINFDIEHVVSIWKQQVRRLLNAIGWNDEKIISRKYKNGANLVITAPIDALYAATEVNEAAWQLTLDELDLETNQESNLNFEELISHLIKEIKDEEKPKLLAIQKAAYEHNVVFLSDDDEVSLGYGATCKIYSVDNIPNVNDIDWSSISDIPETN